MIEEQRFTPMSKAQEKGDEYLKASLVYERAKVRIEEIVQRIAKERNEYLREINASGEEYDESYDVVLCELRGLCHQMGAKADEYWKKMEQTTEKFGPGLERLANAVLAKAAYDYEAALCGGFADSEAEIRLIEKFAKNGAEVYTTLDFSEVLKHIRKVYTEEWKPLVEKIAPELRDEQSQKYKTKCPLCGGGLYYVHGKGQSDLVRCTTCGLFYRIKKKQGRAARHGA
ncbi:MAG: hypothetical protein ACSW8H_00280 [bacterium]